MALDGGQGRRCRLFYEKESWLEGGEGGKGAESLLRPSLNGGGDGRGSGRGGEWVADGGRRSVRMTPRS